MKYFALVIVILFAFTSYALESETVKGAKKDVESFKQEMSTKLNELQTQIDVLKKQAADKGDQTKTKTVAELEANRDKVKKQLGSISDDGKEKWLSVKKSVANSIDSLNTKVQKALQQ